MQNKFNVSNAMCLLMFPFILHPVCSPMLMITRTKNLRVFSTIFQKQTIEQIYWFDFLEISILHFLLPFYPSTLP